MEVFIKSWEKLTGYKVKLKRFKTFEEFKNYWSNVYKITDEQSTLSS